MLGLDNIHKTRCLLIYPINKMPSLKKKWYQMIKLKYTVRNSKTKLNKQKTKEHMKFSFMYVYTYDFRRGVVTDN
jgi:hypothetical protein